MFGWCCSKYQSGNRAEQRLFVKGQLRKMCRYYTPNTSVAIKSLKIDVNQEIIDCGWLRQK